MKVRLKNLCLRCGGKAVFSLVFSDPAKRGGKERGEAPVPIVWECPCGHMSPLTLTPQGSV